MSEITNSLYTPQRQSPVAILLILLRHLRIIARQIWPVFLVLVLREDGGRNIKFLSVLILIGVLSFLYAVWDYTRYYFFVENNELCVRSGIFRRKKLNVPFDRIQSVDFKQNLVHQLLNVVRVQVDTAGSKGSELELDAIDPKRANALREMVMDYKRSLKKTNEASTEIEGEITPEVPAFQETSELLLSLSPYDLIKVGISRNHLRSAAIIFAFLISLADDLDQVMGWNIFNGIGETTSAMSVFGLLLFLLAIPFFIVLSFIITLVGMVLKYYDLKFWRTGPSFKVVAGLLTRTEKTIQKSKIQIMQWDTSPLKKLFGLFQFTIFQATPDVRQNKSLFIPGCYQPQLDQTLDVIVPGFRDADFSTHKMHPRFAVLMVVIFGFLPAAVLWGIARWQESPLQWLALLILPLSIWMGILYQKKRKLKIHPDYLLSESGIFGNTTKLVEIFKVQTVTVSASPFQRRRGLASLDIFTAGGHLRFPYLNEKIARQVRDFVLYRTEIEQRSWM